MPILRKSNKEKYTVIPQNIILDNNLSLKDFGLLVKLLSLPDNWDFSVTGLEKIFTQDGKTSITTGLKNLEKYGYLSRTRKRDEAGKYVDVEWIIREIPTNKIVENPEAENQDLENHAEENPPQYNIKEYNIKEYNINTNYPPTPQGETDKKEVEKKNNKKNIPYEYNAVISYIEKNVTDIELRKKIFSVFSNRVQKNLVITVGIAEQMLIDLENYSMGIYAKKIQILEQSIRNGWGKVCELQNYQKQYYYKSQPQYSDAEQDHPSYDLDAYEEQFRGEKYKEYLEREIENMNKNENKG